MSYETTCLPKLWYVYLKPKLILHFSKTRTCKHVKLKKYTFNTPLIMLGYYCILIVKLLAIINI